MTYEEKEARIAELENLIEKENESLAMYKNELKLLKEDKLIFPKGKYFHTRMSMESVYYKVDEYIGYEYDGDFIVRGEFIAYKSGYDSGTSCHHFKGKYTLPKNRDYCQPCTEKDFNDAREHYFGNKKK